MKIKYSVKSPQLNFLYKTVFVPVIGYGVRVYGYRLNQTHFKKSIRSTQRKVPLNISGAYCTTSLLALCAVTGNMLIKVKLGQDLDVRSRRRKMRRREQVEETIAEIRMRGREVWQQEWSAAEVGRTTYELLPDIEERLQFQHLDNFDHFGIQLLTGHGAFANYLRKHNKINNSRCPICEDKDNPSHPIMECPGKEVERDILEEAIQVAELERPWNLCTIIINKDVYTVLMSLWKRIYARRKL